MAEHIRDILKDLVCQLSSQVQLDAVVNDRPVPAGLSRTPPKPTTARKHAATKPEPVPVQAVPETPIDLSHLPDNLDDLKQVIIPCQKCRLATTRTQIVFGVGNPKSSLVFVGEAPGADEDAQGEPFVGRAGKLLTQMIEAERSLNLKREEVYICNVIKCRPPENRDPAPDEVECCEPYLLRQLDIIKPKVICALGKHAAQTLLKTQTPISQLRGRWFSYHGIPLMPTYHPAYLLRNQSGKKDCWEDLLLIKERLDSL